MGMGPCSREDELLYRTILVLDAIDIGRGILPIKIAWLYVS